MLRVTAVAIFLRGEGRRRAPFPKGARKTPRSKVVYLVSSSSCLSEGGWLGLTDFPESLVETVFCGVWWTVSDPRADGDQEHSGERAFIRLSPCFWAFLFGEQAVRWCSNGFGSSPQVPEVR